MISLTVINSTVSAFVRRGKLVFVSMFSIFGDLDSGFQDVMIGTLLEIIGRTSRRLWEFSDRFTLDAGVGFKIAKNKRRSKIPHLLDTVVYTVYRVESFIFLRRLWVFCYRHCTTHPSFVSIFSKNSFTTPADRLLWTPDPWMLRSRSPDTFLLFVARGYALIACRGKLKLVIRIRPT